MLLALVLLFGLLKAQLPQNFLGSPIGLTLTPQALSSMQAPTTNGYSVSNPYTGVPPIYQPGNGQNVPTNLNPNLYSGQQGYPGQSSGFSMNGGTPVQSNKIGSIETVNPVIGATMDSNSLFSMFGKPSVGSKSIGVQTINPIIGAKVDTPALKGLMGTRSPQKTPSEFSSMFSGYNANVDSSGLGGSGDMFAGMDGKSISGGSADTPTQKPIASSQTYQVHPSYTANEVNQQVTGLNFNSRR